MSTSTSVSVSFRNPILPGFNPDPSIIRVGPDYFLITSTFEYFPGIPLYHSTDLINWTLLGHVLSRPSQLDLRACEPGMGVFAPTIRYHKGRYYVTVCAFHRKSKANGMDVSAEVRKCGAALGLIWSLAEMGSADDWPERVLRLHNGHLGHQKLERPDVLRRPGH
jgi:beta-xylosidase